MRWTTSRGAGKERVLGGRWEYPEDEGHGLREPVPPGWMANRPEDEGGAVKKDEGPSAPGA